MNSEWKVYDHGPLEQLSESVWRVQASLPRGAMKRQMIIARNDDGDLLIHNGVAMQEEARVELEALGNLRWLVIPNAFHRLDAARFKARYPSLTVVAPEGAKHKMPIDVDLNYERFDGGSISAEPIAGTKRREGVFSVRGADGSTLVFNDIIFNQPHLPGVWGGMMKLLGSTGGPRLTGLAKMFFVNDKRALAEQLRRLADTPDLLRAIPAHINPIEEDVSGTLRTIANSVHRG